MHYAVSVKQTMLDAVYFGAISTFLIQTCVSAALLAYGAHLVVRGELHAEVLLAFMLYQSQLQEYVGNLLDACTSMYKSGGAAASVFEIMDRAPMRRVGVAAAEPFRGEVTLAGVHFAYPSRAERPVLCGVSLRAEPGQAVALVGGERRVAPAAWWARGVAARMVQSKGALTVTRQL